MGPHGPCLGKYFVYFPFIEGFAILMLFPCSANWLLFVFEYLHWICHAISMNITSCEYSMSQSWFWVKWFPQVVLCPMLFCLCAWHVRQSSYISFLEFLSWLDLHICTMFLNFVLTANKSMNLFLFKEACTWWTSLVV